jgi:hypothetical protein
LAETAKKKTQKTEKSNTSKHQNKTGMEEVGEEENERGHRV